MRDTDRWGLGWWGGGRRSRISGDFFPSMNLLKRRGVGRGDSLSIGGFPVMLCFEKMKHSFYVYSIGLRKIRGKHGCIVANNAHTDAHGSQVQTAFTCVHVSLAEPK